MAVFPDRSLPPALFGFAEACVFPEGPSMKPSNRNVNLLAQREQRPEKKGKCSRFPGKPL